MKSGKLDNRLLSRLIKKIPQFDKNLLIPPGVGLDAAGLKIGKELLAFTTDPITFSTNDIGTYSVAVNINDIICLGCRPRWYLACLLLPEGISNAQVKNIWNQLVSQLKHYKIQAIGGHVEVTDAVDRPVIIGQMVGEAVGNVFLSPKNATFGDQVLLWRSIAIEGTALLANEHEKKLRKYLSFNKIKAMQNLLYKPGICIWPILEKLIPCKGLVALHDITEGGIATALHEIADASGFGLEINADQIKIRKETALLAKIFKFNPLGLLSSGSALIICKKNAVKSIFEKLGKDDLTLIGELTKSKKRILFANNKSLKLPRFDKDEVIRVIKN